MQTTTFSFIFTYTRVVNTIKQGYGNPAKGRFALKYNKLQGILFDGISHLIIKHKSIYKCSSCHENSSVLKYFSDEEMAFMNMYLNLHIIISCKQFLTKLFMKRI